MYENDEHTDPFPEVADTAASLKARGQIAVDTPEFRAHLEQLLVRALLEEIHEAQRDEFLSHEEAEELRELHAEGEIDAFASQLRIVLPQSSERIRALLEQIGGELTAK